METKIYYESKIFPMSILIFFIIMTFVVSVVRPDLFDMSAVPYLIVVFLILFGLLAWYPVAHLEIHPDKFVYRKGKKFFTSSWEDIIGIYNMHVGAPDFFIATKHGKTSVINGFSLRLIGGKFFCDFRKDFETASGKTILFSEPFMHR